MTAKQIPDRAFALYYRDGKKLPEICQELGCSPALLLPELFAPLTRQNYLLRKEHSETLEAVKNEMIAEVEHFEAETDKIIDELEAENQALRSKRDSGSVDFKIEFPFKLGRASSWRQSAAIALSRGLWPLPYAVFRKSLSILKLTVMALALTLFNFVGQFVVQTVFTVAGLLGFAVQKKEKINGQPSQV